ncbi:LppU/SCO3897 family protein [Streptodolium elevatio]|uniref:Uncharacterized protein n=1 Tax=Streptodolium elevatio TaxID=3157996 RepID=A0ABV3DWD6_9ACTN
MAIPVQGSPYAESPQPPDRPHGHGHRSPSRKRSGLGWVALWAVAVAAVAAYPVYRFAMPLDDVDAQSGQEGLCLAAFEGSLVGGRLPSSVDCLSPEARWRVTARFEVSSGSTPCRELPADKGYETGMEWRSSDGEVLCLTVTPFTTYQDYESIGTMPYEFNSADFDELKTRLLAATGGQRDPAGEAG